MKFANQCGVPPPLPNGQRPGQIFVFPNTYNSQCLTGYSIDGVSQVAAFTASCQPDGEFRGIEECQPVQCGKAPTQRLA